MMKKISAWCNTNKGQTLINGLYAVVMLGASAVSARNGAGAGTVLLGFVGSCFAWCSGVSFARWILSDPLEEIIELQRKYIADLEKEVSLLYADKVAAMMAPVPAKDLEIS